MTVVYFYRPFSPSLSLFLGLYLGLGLAAFQSVFCNGDPETDTGRVAFPTVLQECPPVKLI